MIDYAIVISVTLGFVLAYIQINILEFIFVRIRNWILSNKDEDGTH